MTAYFFINVGAHYGKRAIAKGRAATTMLNTPAATLNTQTMLRGSNSYGFLTIGVGWETQVGARDPTR